MAQCPNRLKELRCLAGLPIAAVAARGEVGSGTIVAIERYGYFPRRETRERIARALNVELTAIWPEVLLGEREARRN